MIAEKHWEKSKFWEKSGRGNIPVDHKIRREKVLEYFENYYRSYMVYPTLTEIARHTHISNEYVQIYIKQLIEYGDIIEVNKKGAHRRYALAVPNDPYAIQEIKTIALENKYQEILDIIQDYYE